MIREITHFEALREWFNANKLIFFCGAGVSQFAPSDLPTGGELLDAYYIDLEEQFKKIALENINLVDFTRLPLETVVEMIVEDMSNEHYSEKVSLIKHYFQEVKPNNIHLLISSFLCFRKSCYVITTNYDDGFENALELLPNKAVIDIFGIGKIKNMAVKTNNNSVFKIHGCAMQDDPNDIVLTTRQESLGLSKNFVSVMKNLFTGSLVVFCGHSISEPDCLEALTEVSDFNVMWIDKDRETFENNYRGQYITQKAREAYFLKDLKPFIESEELWNVVCTHFNVKGLNNVRNEYSQAPLMLNYKKNINKNNGITLFKNLSKGLTIENLYRILICGYLLLREFEKVELLLNGYKKLYSYSDYNYLFWKASIIRDRNNDYKTAFNYFIDATKIKDIKPFEKVSVQVEALGLESVIFQGDLSCLKRIANELESLVALIETQLEFTNTYKKKEYIFWLGLLGRTQKNLIQNLIYQYPTDVEILKSAVDLSENAEVNLTESQEIHARVETLRFKAIIHTSIYLLGEIKNTDELDKALFILEKTLMIFIMLGSDMGEINTRRHYIRVLIMYGKYNEAEKEIDILKKRLKDSPDILSQTKTVALEIILFYRMKKWVGMVSSILVYANKARYISESEHVLHNMLKAFKWLFQWKRFF